MINEFILDTQPTFGLHSDIYCTRSRSETILSESSGGLHADVHSLWRRYDNSQLLHHRPQRVHIRSQRRPTSYNGRHTISRWWHTMGSTSNTDSSTERVTTESDSEALSSPSRIVDNPEMAPCKSSGTATLTAPLAPDKRLNGRTTPGNTTVDTKLKLTMK